MPDISNTRTKRCVAGGHGRDRSYIRGGNSVFEPNSQLVLLVSGYADRGLFELHRAGLKMAARAGRFFAGADISAASNNRRLRCDGRSDLFPH